VREAGKMTIKQLLNRRNSAKDAKQPRKGGFTLIEVMITILLLTVVMSAILSCFVQGFDILMRMKQMTVATQGIQKELELIRNMRYSDILSMDNSFTNDSFSFLESSNGIINLEDSVGAEIKKLTVSVTWIYRGRQMRKEVVTYVTKKGINKK
jgi:prepilin-type N-terminal cleavage/methylation domain-containing protein